MNRASSTAPAFFEQAPVAAAGAARPRPGSVPRTAPCESWTLTAEQVERWLKRARTGEDLVYAHGPTLIDGAAAALVRRLAATKEAVPWQRRVDDRTRDYLIRRNRVRVVRDMPPEPPRVNAEMLIVLVELQDAAAGRRRCPSDAGIAARTGLDVRQVKYQMEKLRRDRLVETRIVPCKTDAKFRIVKIVATGMETAGPEDVPDGRPIQPNRGRQ